ncbi:cellobiose dehydrogenase [Aspergillus nomiae NRRL 13137]|uniref:Cellobiose dehydrogenase n=1 Tax=Aspergillus nomiae NRRL (strain ATCC 15546 / NRRL 13137 / CBS 260.88 / M93) TaxID=1509407 RepID=A0A0L1JCE3_ASPN3|nr:cellobiose dehydrogenase [Aspergillus nomiae NRRL 13137]KNG89419.1 cellobiose dehydrogenase [Aspergillus nomiae NRRL 13137]
MLRPYIYVWLSIFALTVAQLETFTPPGQDGITYSVNIPQVTASSGSGPIYFQLQSTRQLQWFAWGQGSRMQGANIFVVYASGDGLNVTVSPRLGVEHVEPLYNQQARISVLDGTGIHDGTMTANVRCDSCITWPGGSENPSSMSSPWVWAVKYGSPLNTNSLSASITIHDASGIAALDLQKATGGTSMNPFLTLNRTTSSSGQAILSDNSGSVEKRRIAHAVIMIVVFVILFPSFAAMLHIVPSSKTVVIHATFQLFTLALAVAGFGIGISMAKSLDLIQTYHPIIGMVIVPSLILFQPAMGFLQHRYFHRTGKKSVFAYVHRWFGRLIITLGIINGGLGFHLSGIGSSIAPTGAVIAYGVVAGVLGLGFVLVVTFLPRGTRPRGD